LTTPPLARTAEVDAIGAWYATGWTCAATGAALVDDTAPVLDRTWTLPHFGQTYVCWVDTSGSADATPPMVIIMLAANKAKVRMEVSVIREECWKTRYGPTGSKRCRLGKGGQTGQMETLTRMRDVGTEDSPDSAKS
jgi:hypothetical protein